MAHAPLCSAAKARKRFSKLGQSVRIAVSSLRSGTSSIGTHTISMLSSSFADRANADVSRAESVRKFIVLPVQFTQDNKCLTPSMKVVRPKVNEVFAREIDKEIYGR